MGVGGTGVEGVGPGVSPEGGEWQLLDFKYFRRVSFDKKLHLPLNQSHPWSGEGYNQPVESKANKG